MITKLSHVAFFVSDQQKAYDFYVTKLGFKVKTDATMENGFRWLTELRRSFVPRSSSFVTFASLVYPTRTA